MRRIAGSCDAKNECPTAWVDDDGSVVVQGYELTDDLIRRIAPPPGETALRLPADLLLTAARELGQAGGTT